MTETIQLPDNFTHDFEGILRAFSDGDENLAQQWLQQGHRVNNTNCTGSDMSNCTVFVVPKYQDLPHQVFHLLTGRWSLKTCSHPQSFSGRAWGRFSGTPGVQSTAWQAYYQENAAELLKHHLRRCEHDGQCPGHQTCQSDDGYRVVGSAQVTPFQHLGDQLMIIANFWDGLTSHVGLSLIHI